VADRVGLGGIGFVMLRLRTRCVHPDGSRGAWPTGRVESFLELSGLDEIPQMLNVLRGEMSLVGPRPLAWHDLPELSSAQLRTLGARPGMTGRWQIAWVNGASESDMRTLDAAYLRRWRVFHDAGMLVRTPFVIARRGFSLGDTELGKRTAYGSFALGSEARQA
jgi:lipopolysaccharide/colanic/teichoic acid biosynthesis glycosyltransferase